MVLSINGSFLTPTVDFIAYSLCVYIRTWIWRATNCTNFQFALPDKMVLKDDNGSQTIG